MNNISKSRYPHARKSLDAMCDKMQILKEKGVDAEIIYNSNAKNFGVYIEKEEVFYGLLTECIAFLEGVVFNRSVKDDLSLL